MFKVNIPFQTSIEQIANLPTYVQEMQRCGHGKEFIANVLRIAVFDQGMYDLIEMWIFAHSNSDLSEKIVKEMLNTINDYKNKGTTWII